MKYRGLGLKVEEICRLTGACERTIYQDIAKLKASDPIRAERLKHQALYPVARANLIANLKAGNYEAAKGLFKGTGVWTDKVDIEAGPRSVSDEELVQRAQELMDRLKAQGQGQGQPVSKALPEGQGDQTQAPDQATTDPPGRGEDIE